MNFLRRSLLAVFALALVGSATASATEPMFTSSRSNSGWMLNFSFPEHVTKVRFRLPDQQDFTPARYMRMLDPNTGKLYPDSTLRLPGRQGPVEIQVLYEDINGLEKGPYLMKFDPHSELRRGQKEILQQISDSWLEFAGHAPRFLMYTAVGGYSCGVKELRIGIDGKPMRTIPLQPCNETDPGRIDGDTHMDVGEGARFATAQIVFYDGEVSPVLTYLRKR